MNGNLDGNFNFADFFIDRCRYYNKVFDAPPGVHLPEAGASAMNDFILLLEDARHSSPTQSSSLTPHIP